MTTLRALVADEPALRTRVAALGDLIAEKLAELKETVALRQNEGFQAALERSGDQPWPARHGGYSQAWSGPAERGLRQLDARDRERQEQEPEHA